MWDEVLHPLPPQAHKRTVREHGTKGHADWSRVPDVMWACRVSRSHKTQPIVVLRAKLYYSQKEKEKKKANSAKGRGTWGEVRRKPGPSFQESSSSKAIQDTHTSSSNGLAVCETRSTGEAL